MIILPYGHGQTGHAFAVGQPATRCGSWIDAATVTEAPSWLPLCWRCAGLTEEQAAALEAARWELAESAADCRS